MDRAECAAGTGCPCDRRPERRALDNPDAVRCRSEVSPSVLWANGPNPASTYSPVRLITQPDRESRLWAPHKPEPGAYRARSVLHNERVSQPSYCSGAQPRSTVKILWASGDQSR